MNRGKTDARARGGRPRVSAGRVTVRLAGDILERLQKEESMTATISRALRNWYGM